MGYIYLITNTVTGKKYVGQTIQNDIQARWNQHKNPSKASLGYYIQKAFTKYGIDNFKFQIICICFDEACNQMEMEYIKKFNTLAPNGYNLREGGNNSKHHPETNKKKSESMKRTIQDKIARGLPPVVPKTDKIKEKISNSLTGKKYTNGGVKLRKKVGKYDKYGNLIESYDSITIAAIANDTLPTTITKVCKGTYKTAVGFNWKYIVSKVDTV
jgi:group I intron endonuclease